ncbi:MAG: DUF2272 domain-containing protein [Acidimicrobiales bacterium]
MSSTIDPYTHKLSRLDAHTGRLLDELAQRPTPWLGELVFTRAAPTDDENTNDHARQRRNFRVNTLRAVLARPGHPLAPLLVRFGPGRTPQLRPNLHAGHVTAASAHAAHHTPRFSVERGSYNVGGDNTARRRVMRVAGMPIEARTLAWARTVYADAARQAQAHGDPAAARALRRRRAALSGAAGGGASGAPAEARSAKPQRVDPAAVAALARLARYITLAGGDAFELRPDPVQHETAPASTAWAQVRRRAASLARREHAYWAGNNLTETKPAGIARVERYLIDGLGHSPKSAAAQARDPNYAWSAAFISYVLRRAGAGRAFEYSGAHRVFVAKAKQRRLAGDTTAPIWAYRITERAPRVGDLIAAARCSNDKLRCGVTYDTVSPRPYWYMHSDLVVDLGRDADGRYATVIGGNVNQRVGRKRIALDDAGFVKPLGDPNKERIAIVEVGPPTENRPGPTPPAGDPAETAIASAIAAGERNENAITDWALRARHPELGARKLRSDERTLISEWLALRAVVRRRLAAAPTLESGQA